MQLGTAAEHCNKSLTDRRMDSIEQGVAKEPQDQQVWAIFCLLVSFFFWYFQPSLGWYPMTNIRSTWKDPLYLHHGTWHEQWLLATPRRIRRRFVSLFGAYTTLENSGDYHGITHQDCPIGSMYGIYANIWGILMGSMLPSIHGSYGITLQVNPWESPSCCWNILRSRFPCHIPSDLGAVHRWTALECKDIGTWKKPPRMVF